MKGFDTDIEYFTDIPSRFSGSLLKKKIYRKVFQKRSSKRSMVSPKCES